MRKFTTIRKIYEREEVLANLPQNVGMQNDTVTVTTSVGTAQFGDMNATQSSVENVEEPTTVAPQEQESIQNGKVQVQVQALNTQAPEQQQAPEQEAKPESSVGSLFSKLFESREMAHIYHLQFNGQQGSHAAHVALNDYYVGILDMIDDLIETYQGQYGIVDGYDIIDTKDTRTKDSVAYFEEITEYIKHAKQCISAEDTHLHSVIDNIVCLMYKTLYKLKFTK